MHMSRTVLQIPLATDIRDDAYNMVTSQGFSSLQEAVRLVIHKIARGTLRLEVYSEPAPIQLSAKAIKRYNKMDADIAAGKNFKTAKNIDDFMKQLGYEGN